jgi:hypothetical protein
LLFYRSSLRALIVDRLDLRGDFAIIGDRVDAILAHIFEDMQELAPSFGGGNGGVRRGPDHDEFHYSLSAEGTIRHPFDGDMDAFISVTSAFASTIAALTSRRNARRRARAACAAAVKRPCFSRFWLPLGAPRLYGNFIAELNRDF